MNYFMVRIAHQHAPSVTCFFVQSTPLNKEDFVSLFIPEVRNTLEHKVIEVEQLYPQCQEDINTLNKLNLFWCLQSLDASYRCHIRELAAKRAEEERKAFLEKLQKIKKTIKNLFSIFNPKKYSSYF